MKKRGEKRKKKAQFIIGLFFALAAAIVIAGCTPPESGEEQPAEYRIGAVLSVTGPASFLGEPEKKTLEMLEEKLNAEGGIDGVPVRIIIEDDAGEEAKTKMAVSKLIDKDEVLVVLGPSRSGNTIAIKDMMAEKRVPLLSMASAEQIIDPLNDWVFKLAPKDTFVAEHLLMYMSERGINKIAVLYGNTGFGQEGLKQLVRLSPKYGVDIIFKEAYQPGATVADLETLLTKVKSNPDVQAIVNWSILPAQSTIPRKMKELQMDGIVLFHSHGFANIKYVQDAGEAAGGILFPAGRLIVADTLPDDNPQTEVVREYKHMYEDRFNENISTFGGHAWDAFYLTVEAIREAGADREGIRDAIENTTGFIGTGGVFNFSSTEHNGLGLDCIEMMTVKDGEFVPLAVVEDL